MIEITIKNNNGKRTIQLPHTHYDLNEVKVRFEELLTGKYKIWEFPDNNWEKKIITHEELQGAIVQYKEYEDKWPERLFINEGNQYIHIMTEEEVMDAGYSHDLFTFWDHIGNGSFENGDRIFVINCKLQYPRVIKGTIEGLN